MQYTEKVMQHFMNPHNVGVIENPDGYGKVGNPSCGDIMEIFITVDEALQVTNKAVVEALGGLPAVKMHCSVLAEEAIKMAIEDYISKRDGKKAQ